MTAADEGRSSEAYCVDSGSPVRPGEGDRCIKHGNRSTPCFAAFRDPRCIHPRGGSNGSDRCQECGVKIAGEASMSADEDRSEPRTAGSLNADDLGREVTVEDVTGWEYRGVLDRVRILPTGRLGLSIVGNRWWGVAVCEADTPVHIHGEEADSP